MPYVTDEFLSSPSSHTVPCSPYISHVSGSPACVPDVDQLHSIHRTQFSTINQPNVSGIPSTPQALRNPLLQLSESNNLDTLQKFTTPTSSQTSEQVVPSCSPFLSQSETETENCQLQSPRLTSLCEHNHLQIQCNICLEKLNKKCIPLDEKASIMYGQKRQNRNLLNSSTPPEKVTCLFHEEKIFD